MRRPCPLRPANSHSSSLSSEWEKCPIFSTSFILIWVDKICCYNYNRPTNRTKFWKNLKLTHFLIDIGRSVHLWTRMLTLLDSKQKYLPTQNICKKKSWAEAGWGNQRAIHQRKSREVSFFARLTKQSMMSSIQFTEDINEVCKALWFVNYHVSHNLIGLAICIRFQNGGKQLFSQTFTLGFPKQIVT